MVETYYFVTASGRKPVKEFIAQQQKEVQDKIYEVIHYFQTYGFHLETKYLRRMSGTKYLWELRIEYQSNQYRLFLAKADKKIVVLLHVIIKKTAKTPPQDIQIAEKRLQVVKDSLKK